MENILAIDNWYVLGSDGKKYRVIIGISKIEGGHIRIVEEVM